MPNHACFACGALLDDTCGKDAKGRWLCGLCWEKRSVANAKVALQKDTSKTIREHRRWKRIAMVVEEAIRLFLHGW